MDALKFNCPQCEQSLEAPQKLFGQTIVCPSCNNEITVPSPISSANSQTPPPQPSKHPDTKECPFCSERILVNAKKCKHCGEFLEGETDISKKTETESSSSNRTASAVIVTLGYIGLFIGWIVSHFFRESQLPLMAAQAGVTLEEMRKAYISTTLVKIPPCIPALILDAVAFFMGVIGTIMSRYVAGPMLIVAAIIAFFLGM